MELTTDDRAALQGAIRVLVEILQQSPPEVPDTIEEWPEDDRHLRGEFWQDEDGDLWAYRNGLWRVWSSEKRTWDALPGVSLAVFSPFTRTTDPSLPRTWDTLDDVEADVDRAIGDYAGMRREFARGELSESGWFQRMEDGHFRNWVELSAHRTKYVKNIEETS